MLENLKNYFTYNQKERTGALILMCIIFILIMANLLLPYLHHTKKIDYSLFEKEIEKFEITMDKTKKNINNLYADHKIEKYVKSPDNSHGKVHSLFEFNPNNLTYEKWKKLGLSDKQIRVIKNYEQKGGKFYRKTDLKKIYSISEKDYSILEPYIMIPGKKKIRGNNIKNKFEKAVPSINTSASTLNIDINIADSTELISLYGIGPVFASRIIKYRNLLGGYDELQQLLEVFGMDSIRYEKILPNLVISRDSLRKIYINEASFKEILKHPYISYEQVKEIVNYRKANNGFSNIRELKNIPTIDSMMYRKLLPYLAI
ncbi:MAG: helix-hairpin-helix domain-containing protein [Bacteroidales bacterium]|nr:helix-hairpin-helix domain-containing protein [Bacteroidales bacterium]